MIDMTQWFLKIQGAFEKLLEECNINSENKFEPILEDDFLARIYHHFLNNNPNMKFNIFLKSRKILVISFLLV